MSDLKTSNLDLDPLLMSLWNELRELGDFTITGKLCVHWDDYQVAARKAMSRHTVETPAPQPFYLDGLSIEQWKTHAQEGWKLASAIETLRSELAEAQYIIAGRAQDPHEWARRRAAWEGRNALKAECRACNDTGWTVGSPGERIPCDCDALKTPVAQGGCYQCGEDHE